MSAFEGYVMAASALPAMPEVGQQLLRSFEREDVSLAELAALIGKDATLTAQVLRVANTPRFGGGRSIGSVRDAAGMLGLSALRDATLSACLSQSMPRLPGHDWAAYWRECVALGSYAVPLARCLRADDQMAYVGGLMLRLGRVLMKTVHPNSMAWVQQQSPVPDGGLNLESRVLGLNHALVTAEVARHWGFPNTLVEAFTAASDPLCTRPFSLLGAALRLASVVTEARMQQWSVPDGLRHCQDELLQTLQLDPAELEQILPPHELACAGAEGFCH